MIGCSSYLSSIPTWLMAADDQGENRKEDQRETRSTERERERSQRAQLRGLEKEEKARKARENEGQEDLRHKIERE